jgi:hypothetical protein
MTANPATGPPLTVQEAATVFGAPSACADEAYFHVATALLRREDPFPRVEVEGYPPFWAVTRHADVYDISTHHQAWRTSTASPWSCSTSSRTTSSLPRPGTTPLPPASPAGSGRWSSTPTS